MRPLSFVAQYERETAAPNNLHPGLETLLAPSEEWGQYFGCVLHDYLSDAKEEGNLEKKLQEYGHWAAKNMIPLSQALFEGPWPEEERLKAYSRLNFHRLNACMVPQWLLESHRDSKEYKEVLGYCGRISQDKLALEAMTAYISRERQANYKSQFMYFDAKNSATRSALEGALNEFDAAIVLLEIGRKNDLTILPAPPQFERSKSKGLNVDFVVIGPEQSVIGVQAKTNVTKNVVERYDDQILLIDARIDMANELARQTEARRTALRVVGWAGLIAAQRTMKISTTDRDSLVALDARLRPRILSTKMQARSIIGTMPDELPRAASRIGERLMAKLAVSQ